MVSLVAVVSVGLEPSAVQGATLSPKVAGVVFNFSEALRRSRTAAEPPLTRRIPHSARRTPHPGPRPDGLAFDVPCRRPHNRASAKEGPMKARTILPMASLVLLGAASPPAQDPVQVDPTHYSVVLDNPSVRVLRGFLAAGAKSPMHQHPDSIVIAVSVS